MSSSSSSPILVSLLTTLESFSLFLASNIFGISWNTTAVLNGTASRDDMIRFLGCTLIMAHSFTYYFVNSGYELLRLIFTPAQLAPWRAHGEKYAPRSQINKCIAYVTGFHIVASYLIYNYGIPYLFDKGIMGAPGMNLLTSMPTNFAYFFGQLILCLAFTDFFFTLGHRALHEIPFAYEYIHKQHHTFIITESWACEYAHPIELIMGNVLPVLSAPLLLRLHPVVWFTWMILAINGTCQGHSSFYYASRKMHFHAFHHSHNTGNYGSTGVLDALMGTDSLWNEYLAIAKGDILGIFKVTPRQLLQYRKDKREGKTAIGEEDVIARASAVANKTAQRTRSSSASSKKRSGSAKSSTKPKKSRSTSAKRK